MVTVGCVHMCKMLFEHDIAERSVLACFVLLETFRKWKRSGVRRETHRECDIITGAMWTEDRRVFNYTLRMIRFVCTTIVDLTSRGLWKIKRNNVSIIIIMYSRCIRAFVVALYIIQYLRCIIRIIRLCARRTRTAWIGGYVECLDFRWCCSARFDQSGTLWTNTVTRWNNKNGTRGVVEEEEEKKKYIEPRLRNIKGSLNLLTCSTELLTICSTASETFYTQMVRVIFYT